MLASVLATLAIVLAPLAGPRAATRRVSVHFTMGGPPAPAWAPPTVLDLASRRLGKRYDQERCAKLWGSLVTAFGDDKLALRALQRDPSVLDPANDPFVFGRAKTALVEILGGDTAAKDAMLQNPAILKREDVRRLSRGQIRQQALISSVRRADGPIAAAVLCAATAVYSYYLGHS